MSIREILLIIIVTGLTGAALFRPRVGLYGYIWFGIVQPDIIAWVEGKYRFSMILAIATLAGSIRYLPKASQILRLPAVQWFLIFQIPIFLSVVFCQDTFLSPDRYFAFGKDSLMILLIPLLIDSERHMRGLLATFAISELLLGSRFGLYAIVQGGAILTQSYGHVYDNNQLALAIVMLIPICWYCRPLVHRRWMKLGLLGILTTSAAAVIMTNSRGCSLALAVVVLYIALRSKRRIGVLLLLTLAIGPAIYLVKDRYFNRMATIQHYEGEGSATKRIELWKAAIAMWKDHPLVGVGFGSRNFTALSVGYLRRDNDSVVHNSYLQMLVDSGIFALLIYCGLIFGTIIWLEKAIRRDRLRHPGRENIGMAIQSALVAFGVGGTFYSSNLYDLVYILTMAAAAWYQIRRDEAFESPMNELPAAIGEPVTA